MLAPIVANAGCTGPSGGRTMTDVRTHDGRATKIAEIEETRLTIDFQRLIHWQKKNGLYKN